ncbi:MAG: hypothetical protein ACTSXF_08170 [Promethearchaeota archaeon]
MSGNKRNCKLIRPECGISVKGKYKDTCYTKSPIMDWKYNLIVYYDMIEANRNDKYAFRQTYRGYMVAGNPLFTYFLTDGGAGASYKNSKMITGYGDISIFKWKKSFKSYVIKSGKWIYFCTDFVPIHMFHHMGKIYSL